MAFLPVLASVLSTTLYPVTPSSMIKFTLSKVVDMFSDLPERDPHFLVLPLNPSDVSLVQKPQQSNSQVWVLSVSLRNPRTDPAQVTLPDVILNPGQHTELREGFGGSEDRGTLYEGPFLLGWGHERRAVAASAELQGGCTMAWTPLFLLMPLLHCTGQDSPQHPDSPSLTTPTTCRKGTSLSFLRTYRVLCFQGPSPSLC